jgi:hypothetical protein
VIILHFTIPVRSGHCYCSPHTSLNPAMSLNIPRNSVNSNTHKTLPMQQQLLFTPDQLLQLYTAKWLLYIYIVCCDINAVCTLYTHRSLSLVTATQSNSRTLQTAVCVVRRLFCSTESYKTDFSLARIIKCWGKGNS